MPAKLCRLIMMTMLLLCVLPAMAAEEWETANDAGMKAYRDGKYVEAEKQLRTAIAITEKFGKDDLRLAMCQENLAQVYEEQKRYAEALDLYQQVTRVWESILGANDQSVGTCYGHVGDMLMALDKAPEAEPAFKRALEIEAKTLGPKHPEVARRIELLVQCYIKQLKFAEAEGLLKGVLAGKEKALGKEAPELIGSLLALADFYVTQKKFAEAQPLYTRTQGIVAKSFGEDKLEMAAYYNALAGFYLAQEKNPETEQCYKNQVAITEKAAGKMSIELAMALQDYAQFLRKLKRTADAHTLEVREQAIMDALIVKEDKDPKAPVTVEKEQK
ncbi:MAG: tetratricopeptide repeat protein [Armatimonadota bacterium]